MLEDWVKKMKGLRKENKLIDTDHSMVINRGKGVGEEVEEGKREINGDGRRLDFGW